jgi:hypothetical protein
LRIIPMSTVDAAIGPLPEAYHRAQLRRAAIASARRQAVSERPAPLVAHEGCNFGVDFAIARIACSSDGEPAIDPRSDGRATVTHDPPFACACSPSSARAKHELALRQGTPPLRRAVDKQR